MDRIGQTKLLDKYEFPFFYHATQYIKQVRFSKQNFLFFHIYINIMRIALKTLFTTNTKTYQCW